MYRSNATIQRLDQQQVMATIGTYETEGKEWAPSIPQVLARATGNTGTIDRPEPAILAADGIAVHVTRLASWQRIGAERQQPMVNKAKAAGTRYETSIVNRLNDWYWTLPDPKRTTVARRIAEGGISDLGDIELVGMSDTGLPIIIEAKHRQALNLHQTVAKANRKAGLSRSVVFWKKTVRKPGNERRSADGVSEVVAMDVDTFLWLLDGMP